MKTPKRKITEVPLNQIDPPSVVDRIAIDTDKVAELAESILEIGLLQPVLLRPIGTRFEVVAGHRRFLAHIRLKVSTIDALIKEMTDQEAAIIRASENLARENLTPFEEAVIFANLVAVHKMTVDEIAKKFGYKAGTIRRRMDINKMPPELQDAVHKKRISVSVAEELWPISDQGDLDYYLSFALDHGCTKEVARTWCKDWRDAKRRKEAPGGEGGQVFSPAEPRPVFVACDLCVGPMEIGQEVVMRVCQKCYATVKKNM